VVENILTNESGPGRDERALARLKPSDLPAPPQSAAAILRACSDENIDLAHLADIAHQDPGLVAEILRVVNSPLFGLGKDISSARHAISLLGMRALRNMVLCLSVRDAIHAHRNAALDITAYWESALRRAVCARALYQHLGIDGDEGFTAGLLQDFGLLALYLHHGPQDDLPESLPAMDPEQRYHQEQQYFGMTHDAVIDIVREAWSLPRALSEPLRHHHDFTHHGADEPWQNKSRALYCADWVNAVFSCQAPSAAMERARVSLQEYAGLDEAECEALFKAIPQQVESAAQALGLHIERQDDFEAVMRRANSRLAAENISYQELTWKLEKAIAERDRLARELDKEIHIAQEIQRNLLPPPMADDFPVFGLNVPARTLSGDFFDYFTLKDGRIYFCLGDVAGKGINAGLLMAKTSSLFHCLGKHIHDPVRLIGLINDELAESATRGYFVTMVAGVFDPTNARVRLINAGHLPVLVMDEQGESTLFNASAPPIGISPGGDFSHCEDIDLRGRCLYIASDGITERRLEGTEELGMAGLGRLLHARQTLPPGERISQVMEHIAPCGQPGEDDMTLLVVCA
jgi:serine phosphatase RsbU (regulator of sigma subunit)/HD-like signal output (HDOD) protein